MRLVNFHRLKFELERVSNMSPSVLLEKVALKLFGILLGVLLLPISTILHLLGYRHVTVFTDRIGHLALEPDCLLKEVALGLIPSRKWILLAPPRRISNDHLLTYWKPHFLIIDSNLGSFLISNMSRFGLMRHDVSHYARVEGKARESFHVYSKWGMRGPLLTLSKEDSNWGLAELQKLGLPEGKWFVCIHSREGGYSPIDEKIHAHRNGDIESLIPAIKDIVSKGGWVIRLGDRSMRPLPPIINVIDYAHHPLKSPRLDIFLCASCKFFLGSTSGICLVSNLFGIPAAIANMVPVADLWYGPRDISIPKRLWSETFNRYLTLQESIEYPYGCFAYPSQYTDANLKLIDNTPEDITELAIEMMDRLSANQFSLPEDTLTRAFYKTHWDQRFASFESCAHLGVYFFGKYFK